MSKTSKISAKDLGALALPDFCPRCFWIKRNAKLPYQIFPGIFSSIDAYTKKVMHAWFDRYDFAPPWLPELYGVTGYLAAPHWSKFKRKDPATGITISGVVDDLLVCDDGAHIIPDYKTAKFTETQDKLRPMYEVQLNAYAWIQEGFGHPVRSTPLIYCEPVTGAEACTPTIYNTKGFNMTFQVKAIEITRDHGLVTQMLAKAKDIMDLSAPPAGAEDCSDCERLKNIISLVAAP